jgi:formylmethanofuran dehydrogenase subunit E
MGRSPLPIAGRVGACASCGALFLLTQEQLRHSRLPMLCRACYERSEAARLMDDNDGEGERP